MKSLTILLASALLWSGQDTLTYTNPDLNMTFNYPKTWNLAAKSNEANAKIPIEGSEEMATLEIRASVFFSDVETWQDSQARFAESSRRLMVKQWQDTLLGVPLLLTQTQYTEHEIAKTRQTGLVYSATRKKLLYHLTAPTKDFDKVEAEFKQAMQSLRMIDGVMPKPEVPGREKGSYIDSVVTRPPLIIRPDAAKKEAVKAPVAIPCSAGGQSLVLRVPSGWTADKGEGDKIILKHAGLSTPVTISIASTLDSEIPERALIKVTAADLAAFTKVERREDARVKENKAGAKVFTAMRSGMTANGVLITRDAAGQTGDFYWMLGAKWTNPQAYRSDARLVDTLISEMSVEPAL